MNRTLASLFLALVVLLCSPERFQASGPYFTSLAQTIPPNTSSVGSHLIEPLSNGLVLSMNKGQVITLLGQPRPNFDSSILRYDGITVITGGSDDSIWNVTISSGVTLACGIGAGSSMADVINIFGSSSAIRIDNYSLDFSYNGDVVTRIDITVRG